MKARLSGFRRKSSTGSSAGGSPQEKSPASPATRSTPRSANWLKQRAQAAVQVFTAAADAAASFLIEGDDDEVEAKSPPYSPESATDESWWEYYNRRAQANRQEFEARFVSLMRVLGDLSLKADEDAEEAAILLTESVANDDIEAMVALLKAEEKSAATLGKRLRDAPEGAGRVTYPCVEFILENRLIHVLCELGKEDRPVGTMALMLATVAALLDVSHPLLSNQHVHRPVDFLVDAAFNKAAASAPPRKRASVAGADGGGSGSSSLLENAGEAVRVYLGNLLVVVWRKTREDPALLSFFLLMDKSKRNLVRLDMFTALLPLVALPGRAGKLARDASIAAVSARDARKDAFIVHHTPFCRDLATRLAELFRSLLPPLPAAAATSADGGVAAAGGAVDRESEAGGEEQAGADVLIYGASSDGISPPSPFRDGAARRGSTSKAQLSRFLKHLHYCNDVSLAAVKRRFDGSASAARSEELAEIINTGRNGTSSSDGSQIGVAAALVSEMRSGFLEQELRPALLSSSLGRARAAQIISSRMVTDLAGFGGNPACDGAREAHSPLLRCLLAFLFEAQLAAETNGEGAAAEPVTSLRRVLLSRVAKGPPLLSSSVLSLFSAVVDLDDDGLLLSLVLGGEKAETAAEEVAPGVGASSGSSSGSGAEKELAGLRLTGELVEDFCSSFPGSPVHPDVVKFAPQPSLSSYFADACRRQIVRMPGIEAEDGANEAAGVDGGRGDGSHGAAAAAISPADLAVVTAKHWRHLAPCCDSLLAALLERLSGCLTRSLEENVALTSVLSGLCLSASSSERSSARRRLLLLLLAEVPEATADAVAAARPPKGWRKAAGTLTLRTALRETWTAAQAHLAEHEQSSEALARVRSALRVGPALEGEGERGDEYSVLSPSRRASLHGVAAPAELQHLEAYVVLEELLKEIYALFAERVRLGEEMRALLTQGGPLEPEDEGNVSLSDIQAGQQQPGDADDGEGGRGGEEEEDAADLVVVIGADG